MGEFWVTAVYRNPDGESQPSNVVEGWPALPTSDNQPSAVMDKVLYVPAEQSIRINTSKKPEKITVVQLNGGVVKSILNPSGKIRVADLASGFYIVEVYCGNTVVIRQKIVK